MGLDIWAEQLVGDVALALQELPTTTLEVIGLWRFAVAGDAHMAEMTNHPMQLQATQHLCGMVIRETGGTGELSYGQETIALNEEEAQHGGGGEGKNLTPSHARLPP